MRPCAIVGQTYKDRDSRQGERFLTITALEGSHAVCTVSGKATDGHDHERKTTRVKISRITGRKFELLSMNVPQEAAAS